MPIRWSAVEVSEAMDKAEAEFNKAHPYVQKIEDIAREARGIRNLPGILTRTWYVWRTRYRTSWPAVGAP